MVNRRVLVLNFDYRPLTVTNVQKAFLMVFLEKAEMITKSNGFELRSVNNAYPLPSVIKLKRYVNAPFKQVMLTRQNVFKRDGFACSYCGSKKHLTIDHVVPRSKKGKSTWNNLVTACQRCNSKKGNGTPEQAGLNLKEEPFKPSYALFIRKFSGYVDHEWKPFLDGWGSRN
ncbi:MAG: HNH endonuclease [Bacteroidota bacterium]